MYRPSWYEYLHVYIWSDIARNSYMMTAGTQLSLNTDPIARFILDNVKCIAIAINWMLIIFFVLIVVYSICGLFMHIAYNVLPIKIAY